MNGRGSSERAEKLADDIAKDVFGERLLTPKRVAQLFNVKVETVREWIARGELLGIKVGKEYRVPESALREYKEEKEQEQRRFAQEKRLERQRQAELTRRRDVDPAARWDLTNCIACGVVPTFSTRPDRKDGDVLCEACIDRVGEKGLSKVAWDRKVNVRVEELNQVAEAELNVGDVQMLEDLIASSTYVPRQWVTYRCGWCEKPQPLRRRDLYDPRFLPDCDHSPPFGAGGGRPVFESEWDQDFGQLMLIALAQVEARERNLSDGCDSDPQLGASWLVCDCAICERPHAVATRDRRLIGDVRCRLCTRASETIAWDRRVIAIHRTLSKLPSEGIRYVGVCECGGRVLAQDLKVALSACEKMDVEQRKALALAFVEKHSIGPEATSKLVEEVSGLDDLPF